MVDGHKTLWTKIEDVELNGVLFSFPLRTGFEGKRTDKAPHTHLSWELFCAPKNSFGTSISSSSIFNSYLYFYEVLFYHCLILLALHYLNCFLSLCDNLTPAFILFLFYMYFILFIYFYFSLLSYFTCIATVARQFPSG